MKRIRGDIIRKSTSVGLIAMLILSMLTMMAVPSVSGDDVVVPTAFYGDVTVNGLPAPVGTVVTGTIDSAEGSPGNGSITVTEAGKYGGAGGFDPKLSVQTNSNNDIGKTIQFTIKLPSGEEGTANQTATYNSTIQELDLTALALAGTPPTITSFTPSDTTPHDDMGATRTFTVTVDQPVTVSWQINGTEVETDTVSAYTPASYTNLSAVAGFWGVSAVATNVSSGWPVTQTWYWTVEDTTYQPSVTEPQANPSAILLNVDTTELSVKVTKTYFDIDTVTVDLSQIGGLSNHMMGIKEIVSSTVSIYNCTTNSSVVGNFSLPVNATDIQGNSNTSVSISLTVTSDDTIPPVITSPTATPSSIPADGATTSTLNVTVTDNVGVASVTVDLSALGGSATTAMTQVGATDVYSVTTTASILTSTGTKSLTVTATDISANTATSSISLTVTEIPDTFAPIVTNPTATPSAIYANEIAISQLSVTVTDNVGVASVTVDLSALGGSATTAMTQVGATDVYSVTTNAATSTTPGSYSLTVTATDGSANANTSVSISLTVNAVPASTTSLSIENPTASRAQNFTARIDMTATVAGWYVVVVSGTESGGESIAGVGTVYLAAGQSVTDMPILVHISSQATAGTYTLYAGAYAMGDYPTNLGNIIEHEGPVTVTVT